MPKNKSKAKKTAVGTSAVREPLFLDKEIKRKAFAEKVVLSGRFFEGFDWLVVVLYLFFFFRMASFRWETSLVVIVLLALVQSLIFHRIFFAKLVEKDPRLALNIDISFVLLMLLFLVQFFGGVASPLVFLYIIILAVAAFAFHPYFVFLFLAIQYLFIYFSATWNLETAAFVSRYYELFFWEVVFLSLSAVLLFILSSLYLSERKLHEKLEYFSNQLVADKGKSETVLQSMSDGVFVTDLKRNIIFVNEAACKLIRIPYSKREKIIKRFYGNVFKLSINGEKLDYDNDCPLELAISEGKPNFSREYSLDTGYKEPIFAAMSAAPVVDASGNTQGAVAVIRDITKEKEIERLQNEFVSIASHELLTPITQVQGHLSMLVDENIGKIDDTAAKLINNAYGGIKRIGRLVKDLMHVSQIERETMKMNMQKVDMEKYISDIVKDFELQAKNCGIFIKFDKPSRSVLGVLADPDRLSEVFNNLIGNALKFTKKGGITISLSEKKSGIVEVSISDTGVGIPAQEIPNLFQKFYQVDSSATRESEGTGLGLYISKKMIEMMGGDIWIKSKLGSGTTFTFTLKTSKKK